MAACNTCEPAATACEDDADWSEATHADWNCATYATGQPNDGFCTDADASGTPASEACPVSCGSCPPAEAPRPPPPPAPPGPPDACSDDAAWREATHADWNCASYAAGQPNDGFCTDLNAAGVSANDACRVSCGTCDGVVDALSPPPAPPASCGSFPEFSVLSQAVTAACCTAGVECPPGGIPTTCTAECASVLLPMQVRTHPFLLRTDF